MPTKYTKKEIMQALAKLQDDDYICPVCELPELISTKGESASTMRIYAMKEQDFCWCTRDD